MRNIGMAVILFACFAIASNTYAVGQGENDAYQQYIEAYNKLTQLMSQGKGETPQAQAAYKDYAYKKAQYEKYLEGNQAQHIDSQDKKSAPQTDHVSEYAAGSMKEAYNRYIAAYNKLSKMVTKTPILGPPELKDISDRYHRNWSEYNRSKDHKAYQAYIAAYNRLTSMAIKVDITCPPALKKAQDDFYRAKAEYDVWTRRKQR